MERDGGREEIVRERIDGWGCLWWTEEDEGGEEGRRETKEHPMGGKGERWEGHSLYSSVGK